MSGTSSASTAAQEHPYFSCDIAWQITLKQNLETGTISSILSLGDDNLVAYFLEHPTQESNTHSRSGEPGTLGARAALQWRDCQISGLQVRTRL
jgi:hypothetical protein